MIVQFSDIAVSQDQTNNITDEVLEVRPFRLLKVGTDNISPLDQINT